MRFKGILFVIITLFLVACGHDIETNMSEPVADFEFTTQDESKLSLEDLEGDWWIANFMYTNCRTVCPRTTANMATLQKSLHQDGFNPQIVSFSVDPSFDTPNVLKEYAKENDADLNSWSFLTGYDFNTIQELSEENFKAVLEGGAADQRSHSYSFYLVNPEGVIVKKYDGMSENELDHLAEDIKTVL